MLFKFVMEYLLMVSEIVSQRHQVVQRLNESSRQALHVHLKRENWRRETLDSSREQASCTPPSEQEPFD